MKFRVFCKYFYEVQSLTLKYPILICLYFLHSVRIFWKILSNPSARTTHMRKIKKKSHFTHELILKNPMWEWEERISFLSSSLVFLIYSYKAIIYLFIWFASTCIFQMFIRNTSFTHELELHFFLVRDHQRKTIRVI